VAGSPDHRGSEPGCGICVDPSSPKHLTEPPSVLHWANMKDLSKGTGFSNSSSKEMKSEYLLPYTMLGENMSEELVQWVWGGGGTGECSTEHLSCWGNGSTPHSLMGTGKVVVGTEAAGPSVSLSV
jgi:hypothetical protein